MTDSRISSSSSDKPKTLEADENIENTSSTVTMESEIKDARLFPGISSSSSQIPGVEITEKSLNSDLYPNPNPTSVCRNSNEKPKSREMSNLPLQDVELKITDNTDTKKEADDKIETDPRNEEKEESSTIRFHPPAYIQRYSRVRHELHKRLVTSDDSPKSILEVGCADLSMHPHLKNLPKVQKLMYLDIDTELLERVKHKILPFSYESVIPRETPLTVEVYSGCITKTDIRITDAVPPLYAIVGIEILEHLDEDIEIEFISTLFEKYAPPLVILTTPNSDFNSVLGLKQQEFRHWDHRFEMTRLEFFTWCSSVCRHCPRYKFTIEGICDGPPGTEQFGSLSQMAVFELKENIVPSPSSPAVIIKDANSSLALATAQLSIEELVESESKPVIILNEGDREAYSLIESVEYPWKPKKSLRDQVIEEVRYYVKNVLLAYERLEEFWENSQETTDVPLRDLLRICRSLPNPNASDLSEQQLRSWLQDEKYRIKGNLKSWIVIVKVPSFQEYHDSGSDSPSENETSNINYDNCVESDEVWD